MKKRKIKGYCKKKIKLFSGITIIFDDTELFED